MKLSSSLLVILGAIALANCEVFFEEKFLDGKLTAWINSCWVLAGDDDERIIADVLSLNISFNTSFNFISGFYRTIEVDQNLI